MSPALLPVWILLAPLALVMVDWLLAPKTTSMMSRESGKAYALAPQAPGVSRR